MMNQLLAQIVWYLLRLYTIGLMNTQLVKMTVLKYSVTLSNQNLTFYKSEKSQRLDGLTNDSYLDNKTKLQRY